MESGTNINSNIQGQERFSSMTKVSFIQSSTQSFRQGEHKITREPEIGFILDVL